MPGSLLPLLVLLLFFPLVTPQFREERKILYEDFPEVDYVFAVPRTSQNQDADAQASDTSAGGDEDGGGGMTDEQKLLMGIKVTKAAKTLEAQLKIVKDLSAIKPSQSRYIAVLRDLQKKTSISELDELLKMHPDILAVKLNDYIYEAKEIRTTQWNRGVDYRVEVIFNPCYERAHDCCIGIFGTPEYVDFQSKRVFFRNMQLIREDNRRYPAFFADFTDPSNKIIGVCKSNTTTNNIDRHKQIMLPSGNNTDVIVYNDLTCEADYLERRESPVMPRCWDYNSTVRSAGHVDDISATPITCIDGHGVKRKHCITVGYSINNYLFQCADGYDPVRCGTWLEIHIPEDERIVAERQLPGGYAVGYQVIDMPLTYKFSANRVICAGDYEIWWVQRTPSRKMIQYRKKFRVMWPPCDFNRILDKYTRFFDFRYDVKNSLDGSSISLEDLLDISTTASSADIGV